MSIRVIHIPMCSRCMDKMLMCMYSGPLTIIIWVGINRQVLILLASEFDLDLDQTPAASSCRRAKSLPFTTSCGSE